ncbi:MAG TPA: hypothetical protein VJ743_07310, partial [Albitalea sp.]|nr:hypothetical protein [Albitalea sp.]
MNPIRRLRATAAVGSLLAAPLAANAYLPPNNGYGAYARADTFYNGGNAQTAATAYNAAVNDVTAASANLDDGK